MIDGKTFSGIRRARKTKPTVFLVDKLARTIITLGGLGTIFAVLLVCFFLIWWVIPLFAPAVVTPLNRESPKSPMFTRTQLLAQSVPNSDSKVVKWLASSTHQFAIGITNDAKLICTEFKTRTVTNISHDLLREARSVAISLGVEPIIAAQLNDGSVRIMQVGFLNGKPQDGSSALVSDVLELKELGLLKADPTFKNPVICDVMSTSSGPEVLVQSGNQLSVWKFTQKRSLGGSKSKQGTTSYQPMSTPFVASLATFASDGKTILAFASDGKYQRIATVAGKATEVIEQNQLPVSDLKLGRWLVGRETLLLGERGFALARSESATAGSDGKQLIEIHRYGFSAPTAFGISDRSRMFVAGNGAGTVTLTHGTSERVLSRWEMGAEPVQQLALSDREDLVLIENAQGIWPYSIHSDHAEVSWKTLFGQIHYEGYDKPSYIWQTSGGTSAEPKYSLIPLIFGTLKATLYSMLIGAPIAILSAIYSSQFLHSSLRAKVKPTIELMAGLPSVVLGFFGGLILAPLAEQSLGAIILSMLLVPFALLLGAHLWNFLPRRIILGNSGSRIIAIVLLIPLVVYGSFRMGGVFEQLLFGSSIVDWLAMRQVGDLPPNHHAYAGWFIVFFPLIASIAGWMSGMGWLNFTPRQVSRRREATFALAQFLIMSLLVCGVTLGISILAAMLADSRGILFNQYDSRNALVVGFVMGFAIIPIIFTISDDALSAVPDHLRSASLGCGATPWQTAMRVIVPTATSGIFSALMIGLGRAVGETMIVVMATGNTPIMEWNIFNGFATLSARIATEMPEAPKFSTHYRVLFLAALTLFSMTFVLNTLAEAVRRRYQKKTAGL